MLNNCITDIKDNCDLFLCTDITCENIQHKQEIDKICVSLIDCCIDCSKLTIPITKPYHYSVRRAKKIMINAQNERLADFF